MRLLVTGTTGGIGTAVKSAALARGWQVAEVNRGGFDEPLGDAPFDGVVFATGTCPVKPLSQTDDAMFADTVGVNCGLFLKLARRIVAERLYSPRGTRIVAVSSVSAVEGWPGGTAYCASKGALSALCRALDAELRPRGISVAAVEPRHVRTRMFFETAGRMGVDPASARDPGDLAGEILAIVAGEGEAGR